MTSEEKEKDKNGSDSTLSFSLFNPLKTSSAIEDSDMMTDESSSPQNKTTDPNKGKPDSEPLPSSVCFADQADNEKPERPIGPMQNADKIISETKDVIGNLFQLLLKQRRFLLVSAYQISSLQSIVEDHHGPHVGKIDTFLTHSNSFQTEWFFRYYNFLPGYVDYATALKDSAATHVIDEVPDAVQESDLKYLAENAIKNMFAGALLVKAQRSLNTDVSLWMDTRNQKFPLESLAWTQWMCLFEMQSQNAKRVERTCFDLLSSVDLLGVDRYLLSTKK